MVRNQQQQQQQKGNESFWKKIDFILEFRFEFDLLSAFFNIYIIKIWQYKNAHYFVLFT